MREGPGVPPPPSPPPDTGWQTPPRQATYRAPAVPPVVTYSLLGLTVLVYILQEASGFLYGIDLPASLGMKVNAFIEQGEWWRLITPMFLHGSLLHIFFNMYALRIFGPRLERYYGHWRFLALYFLGGFAGNVASFIFSPANSLGSSTAIFGLIGAEAVFLYQNQKIFGGSARGALTNIIMIAAINLFIGLSPGIDNWGHAGGLAGGSLFAWLAGPVLGVEGFFPSFSITDSRESRMVIIAILVVGLLIALLAVAAVYTRLGPV